MIKTIRVAVKGSMFGGQYVIGGSKELYSVWSVRFDIEKGMITKESTPILISYNLDKKDCSKKALDNYQKYFCQW